MAPSSLILDPESLARVKRQPPKREQILTLQAIPNYIGIAQPYTAGQRSVDHE